MEFDECRGFDGSCLYSFRSLIDVVGSNYSYLGGGTSRCSGMLGLMSRNGLNSGFINKSCRSQSFGVGSMWRRNTLPSVNRQYASQASVEQKSKKMLWYLTALVFGMVGCSYAAVPLYRRFCQATGYGGTVQRREVRLSFSY